MIHLPALVRLRSAAVTAIAESDPHHLKQAARLAPAATCYSDYRTLLEDDRVDAVVICLPTNLHADAAITSFAAGKHVYVEKPLATSVDEGQQVLDAWKASGKVGTIGLNLRFHPLYRAMKQQITSGVIGNVVAVRTSFCAAPRALPEWKQHRGTGGGALLDLATHHIDLARYMFTQEIREVDASVRSLRSEDDTASIRMHLEDSTCIDTLVSITASEDDRFEVYGDAGRLIADRFGARGLQWAPVRRDCGYVGRLRAGFQALVETPRRVVAGLFPPLEPSFALALQSFVDAVAMGQAPQVSLDDGYRSLVVVGAAEESAKSGRPVTICRRERSSPPRLPGSFDLEQMKQLQAEVSRAAADPTQAAMGVVLVTRDCFASIRRTVRFLREQTIANKIELILVGPNAESANDRSPDETSTFHSVKTVGAGGPIDNVDKAAAHGIRAASAPVVTLIEDHAFPEPQYAQALLDAHKGPWAVVGSVVLNANPDTSISWANLLLAYGSWAEPVQRGESRNISRHNVSFKRGVLEEFGESLEFFLGRDGGFHQILLKRGHRFFLETGARIYHANPSRLAPTIELRFNGGRLASATRARMGNWPIWRRALYVAGTPLIPLLRARPLYRKVAGNQLFPRVCPALLLALILDGIGQMLGFALGQGSTAERLARFEYDRLRHLTPRDRELLKL